MRGSNLSHVCRTGFACGGLAWHAPCKLVLDDHFGSIWRVEREKTSEDGCFSYISSICVMFFWRAPSQRCYGASSGGSTGSLSFFPPSNISWSNEIYALSLQPLPSYILRPLSLLLNWYLHSRCCSLRSHCCWVTLSLSLSICLSKESPWHLC